MNKEETKIKKIKNWLMEHAEFVTCAVYSGVTSALFAYIGYRIGIKTCLDAIIIATSANDKKV